MPTRVSYEPSIQALVAELLSGARIISRPLGLRNRVSWPVVVRATGLGRLEGGELVLVPRGREESVLHHLDDLAAIGVSAVLLCAPLPDGAPDVASPSVPVLVPEAEVELRRVREEVERYVARRRRELFAVDQEMHRTLVDAAIAGASLRRLVDITSDVTGRPALLDRGGEPLTAGTEPDSIPPRLLREVRLAVQEGVAAVVLPSGSELALAMPVVTAGLRRGIAVLMEVSARTVDEDEIVLAALASGAAIAAAREPAEELPSREAALRSDAVTGAASSTVWTGFAIAELEESPERAARSLSSELEARNFRHVLARDGDVLVGIAAADVATTESLLRLAARRMGVEEIRAGVSRARDGVDAAEKVIEEARRAVDLGDSGITRFEAVELTSLLANLRGAREYVEGRLGPVMARQDLLRTLEAYLDSGRKVGEAAAALHIHRNTLNYRLARIKELLRGDLDESETAFALQLALRLLRQDGPGQDQDQRSRR